MAADRHARLERSRRLAEDAREVLAGGATHDMRHLDPFPVAVRRAAGARKWDLDGNEYVDLILGHGSLLLGHGDPAVRAAVERQLRDGWQPGAPHEGEVRWAELVCRLVPSAERVRFTASGTEAALLATRVVRIATGRDRIVKFQRHFHGWGDVGLAGMHDPLDEPPAGVPAAAVRDLVAIPQGDHDRLRAELAAGDVAAVFVEPSGTLFGQVPLAVEQLTELRELTTSSGALLVFDEVVTGFRWSPGGLQQLLGIIPDVTVLGKVLGGGLPAGAVAGRADVMEVHDLRPDPGWNRYRHAAHFGSYNGHALSAAAGIATLEHVATGGPTAAADTVAAELRRALQDELDAAGIEGRVHGVSSVFHVDLGPGLGPDGDAAAARRMGDGRGAALRRAMLQRGVDVLGTGGVLSSVHDEDDVAAVAAAFGAAVRDLEREGALEPSPAEARTP